MISLILPRSGTPDADGRLGPDISSLPEGVVISRFIINDGRQSYTVEIDGTPDQIAAIAFDQSDAPEWQAIRAGLRVAFDRVNELARAANRPDLLILEDDTAPPENQAKNVIGYALMTGLGKPGKRPDAE